MNREIIRLQQLVKQANTDRQQMQKAFRDPSYPFISKTNKDRLKQLIEQTNNRLAGEYMTYITLPDDLDTDVFPVLNTDNTNFKNALAVLQKTPSSKLMEVWGQLKKDMRKPLIEEEGLLYQAVCIHCGEIEWADTPEIECTDCLNKQEAEIHGD